MGKEMKDIVFEEEGGAIWQLSPKECLDALTEGFIDEAPDEEQMDALVEFVDTILLMRDTPEMLRRWAQSRVRYAAQWQEEARFEEQKSEAAIIVKHALRVAEAINEFAARLKQSHDEEDAELRAAFPDVFTAERSAKKGGKK